MPTVIVNKKGARRGRNGHPWIFKSDVISIDANGGDVVTVRDEAGNFVGNSFFSDSSEITLRIFEWRDRTIDESFWRDRLEKAISRRSAFANCSDSFRLVNGESDLIPSLIVDRYGDHLSIQTLSQGADRLKSDFVRMLREILRPKTIIERNDVKIREKENLPQTRGILHGEPPSSQVTVRHGIKYEVDLLNGQKTGSFLDQNENHHRSGRYSKGRVLDCFTFHGGFAMNMARSSDSVIAVDISDEAVKQASRNSDLNGIGNIEFKCANVFDFLRECEEGSFDTVVLDPPAFVKSKSALSSAIRGYKEINLRAMKLLASGGTLMTYSCSHHFTRDLFEEVLRDAARDARRKVQILERQGQPADHPVLLGMPESDYLKGFVLGMID